VSHVQSRVSFLCQGSRLPLATPPLGWQHLWTLNAGTTVDIDQFDHHLIVTLRWTQGQVPPLPASCAGAIAADAGCGALLTSRWGRGHIIVLGQEVVGGVPLRSKKMGYRESWNQPRRFWRPRGWTSAQASSQEIRSDCHSIARGRRYSDQCNRTVSQAEDAAEELAAEISSRRPSSSPP
jgi:hypothetical protein